MWVEALEGRWLLAATLSNGTLTVTGTLENDAIQLWSSFSFVETVVNGDRDFFDREDVQKISVFGAAGDDVFAVHARERFPIGLQGGPGTDAVFFYSSDDPDIIEVGHGWVRDEVVEITFGTHEVVGVSAGDGNDIIVIQESTPAQLVIDGGGDGDRLVINDALVGIPGYDGIDALHVNAGHYTVTEDLNGIDLHVAGTGVVQLAVSQHLRDVSVAADGFLAVGENGANFLRMENLSIDGGVFEISDADVFIDSLIGQPDAVLANVQRWIASGRNGGDERWLGQGITSGLAYVEPLTTVAASVNARGGVPIYESLWGEELNTDTVLLVWTYNGDVNLDGRVNADDYFAIHSGFLTQRPQPTFAEGDFNYDQKINADDYFLIDSAFLGQATVTVAEPMRATVPARQDRVAVEPPARRKHPATARAVDAVLG